MSKILCDHFPRCGGCQYIGEEDSAQKDKKQTHFSSLVQSFSVPIKDLGWISAGPAYLRDRLDFVWENGIFGLYSPAENQIIDIQFCHQLSPALNDWFQEFRKIKWPIKKGSVRLRVGPQGLRGVWLDFANLDIKNLLAEQTILTRLLENGIQVEMGQKRKILKLQADGLKLKDPEPQIWFESSFRNRPIPLYSHIASFSQPSMKANHLILRQIEDWASEIQATKASEFGAGIGNLSLPLLGWVDHLRIFENDALSLECFHLTLDQTPELQAQKRKIELQVGDYQLKKNLEFDENEILMVNPPRSGLKGFLQTLESCRQKPKDLIYMSCAPVTWVADGKVLELLGYRLQEAMIVDQFPQTQHYEILSRWSLQ